MGDDQQLETTSTARSPLRYGKRVVLLVLAGASLYLLLPSLLAVFGSWRSLSHLDWPFAVLVLVCEVAS
jgi:threonine/homoserine/homoserine lactone efflux protein